MNLQWIEKLELSALHAAWCITNFPQRSTHCGEVLKDAAERLGHIAKSFELPGVKVSRQKFWETLLVAAANESSKQVLAERLLTKLDVPTTSPRLTMIVSCLRELKSAFQVDFPNFTQEVTLRKGPLQQQWEAHGPGLLHQVSRFTDSDLLVDSATVFLVQPIIGGAGYAHLLTNCVHVEAVLTNEEPQLPETLRLAWLLSQLDFERPVYSEGINAFNLRRIAGLAMIPPTLRAAEELELCSYSQEIVMRAIEVWHSDVAGAQTNVLAEILVTWWETYESSRPTWNIALTGLDRMLEQL